MIAKVITCLLALATAGLVRAGDPTPEPPGNVLARLQGKWKARALLIKGQKKDSNVTYTFDKGKVTYSFGPGKGVTRELTVVPDKTRRDLISMTPKGSSRSVQYFFKLAKGELHLAPVRRDDAKPKPDFSGDTAPVLILRREK